MFGEALEKAGINGIVTGAVTASYFGLDATVVPPFMNMTMPLYIVTFLGGCIASLATDGLHTFLKEEVPISKKANDRSSVIAGLAINAIIFAGLLELYDGTTARDFGRISALLIGAGSEFASASAYTYLKEKMYL